jgi:chemotaxis protein methyltransferase CheR
VTYQIEELDWKLTVSDNGVGADPAKAASDSGGLGSALVEALARQLRAKVEIASNATGMRVSITRVTFVSTMPEAA